MDRKQKIRLLQNIVTGRLTIEAIETKKISLPFGLDYSEEDNYLINGVSVSKSEWQAEINRQGPSKHKEEIYED